MTPQERFAANLKRLRKAAGLSQEELSFRAAVHRTQVSLLESGNRLPRALTLVQLAGSLDATPNDLLGGIAWEPIISISGGMVVTASLELQRPEDGDDAERDQTMS
jgi:transcriptional regulator with XRE-family HTH domain